RVVVPTAPVVPNDDDRRRFPVAAFADCVYDRGDPGRATVIAATGVIGVDPIRRHPRHAGKISVAHVAKDLRLRRDDVLPIGPVTHAADRIEFRPDLPADSLQRRSVILPRYARGVDRVGNRWEGPIARKRTVEALDPIDVQG